MMRGHRNFWPQRLWRLSVSEPFIMKYEMRRDICKYDARRPRTNSSFGFLLVSFARRNSPATHTTVARGPRIYKYKYSAIHINTNYITGSIILAFCAISICREQFVSCCSCFGHNLLIRPLYWVFFLCFCVYVYHVTLAIVGRTYFSAHKKLARHDQHRTHTHTHTESIHLTGRGYRKSGTLSSGGNIPHTKHTLIRVYTEIPIYISRFLLYTRQHEAKCARAHHLVRRCLARWKYGELFACKTNLSW